jgi:hypothetical protein
MRSLGSSRRICNESTVFSATLALAITVIPTTRGGPNVAHRMALTGRNEDFLSWLGTQGFAGEHQFYLTLDGHEQFIGRVHKVFPHLSRWIDPDSATEAPALPFTRYLRWAHPQSASTRRLEWTTVLFRTALHRSPPHNSQRSPQMLRQCHHPVGSPPSCRPQRPVPQVAPPFLAG